VAGEDGGRRLFGDGVPDALRAAAGCLEAAARERAGIDAADSVAVDLHKLLWQPAGCGAFLVRDRDLLARLEVTVPYLNPDPRRTPPRGGRCRTWSAGRSPPPAASPPHPAAELPGGGRRAIGRLVDRTLELAASAASAAAAVEADLAALVALVARAGAALDQDR
jgi:glutamate/tyrosine decarboxylase-like PLP-dependent enzyme